MSDCSDVQDRMLEVAHQQVGFSAAEEAHVATCPACAHEWQIVSEARALSTYHPADLRAMSEALLERLRTDLPTRRATSTRQWAVRPRVIAFLAVAASIALVVWAPMRGRVPTTAPIVATASADELFPELLPLNEEQLQQVLQAWEAEEDEGIPASAPSLEDLSEEQLKAMLRQVEEGL